MYKERTYKRLIVEGGGEVIPIIKKIGFYIEMFTWNGAQHDTGLLTQISFD